MFVGRNKADPSKGLQCLGARLCKSSAETFVQYKLQNHYFGLLLMQTFSTTLASRLMHFVMTTLKVDLPLQIFTDDGLWARIHTLTATAEAFLKFANQRRSVAETARRGL